MNSIKKAPLGDVKIHVRMKLAALWTSVMFCYIYADYFELYQPGKLHGMLLGTMQPLGPVTQPILLVLAVMMALPSVMIFLSLAVSPNLNRFLNIIAGVIYTLIILLTMPGTWSFYIFFSIIEIALTSLVVWYAWSWPRD